MHKKDFKWFISAFFLIILDQLTKFLAMTYLTGSGSVKFIPGVFNFDYVKNTGAAFSILEGKTVALGIVSIVFCIAVAIYWFKAKLKSNLCRLSIVLLFAGAFGNAIDRLFRGFVVDFIQTAFMDFPVFNVADSAITIGAILLVVYLVFFDKDEKADGEKDNNGN